MKKGFAFLLIPVLLLSILVACATKKEQPPEELPTIDSLNLGEDHTDITTSIKILTFRTDIMDKLESYATAFHEMYPNITVAYEGITDYETNTIMYLTSGIDWGDVMMIPLGIGKDAVSDYFLPLGKADTLSAIYNFTNAWTKDGIVYGIASTGNANGLIYNKRVFQDAGIIALPTTPEAFLSALTAIRENTEAIPLYTNYADEWPMSSWDAYIGINATGSAEYMCRTMLHESNPFSDREDGTHPYAVYKILYDAVSKGLTEEDYTTTSEAMCYNMLNEGKIGVLAFSSWAVAQAQTAGSCPQDVGLMPFPITVDGKQYVSINGDYSYGINRNANQQRQIASMLYIKWLLHESGFDYSEGGLSVVKGGENPEYYDSLNNCIILEDLPEVSGEEGLFNAVNVESGLLINANGNAKGQELVEHAFLHDMDFDQIMSKWNSKWNDAQTKLGVTVRIE